MEVKRVMKKEDKIDKNNGKKGTERTKYRV
jgi:hypothetical protein